MLLGLSAIAATILLRNCLLGARECTSFIFGITGDQQFKDDLLAAEAAPWCLIVLSLATVEAILLALPIEIEGKLDLALSLDELLELALLLT